MMRVNLLRGRPGVGGRQAAIKSGSSHVFVSRKELLLGSVFLLLGCVILFTQFRDTAAYLHTRLALRFRCALIDGGVEVEWAAVPVGGLERSLAPWGGFASVRASLAVSVVRSVIVVATPAPHRLAGNAPVEHRGATRLPGLPNPG